MVENSNESYKYYSLGRENYDKRRYSDALMYFEKAISLNSNNADYYYWSGLCEYKLENYVEAIDNFAACIDIEPDEPEYFFRCGICKYKMGSYDEAIEDFTAGIELNPEDVFIYYQNRGTAKQKKNDNKGAAEDYHLALKFAKDDKQRTSAINKLKNIKFEKIDIKSQKEIHDNNFVETNNADRVVISDNTISWFGIDFGTTNSALVAFTGTSASNIKVIPYGDDEGRPQPSLVAIKKDGSEIMTGRAVKDNLSNIFEDYEYIPSIKSILKEDKEWNIQGQIYTPTDIAAELFKSLISKVEKAGDRLDKAVVAVPIGFSSKEKEKLRQAAQKAGFKIIMFVSEPTAACCSNYQDLKMYNNVAVFDWGGGTLDVAVINIESGKIKEIATDGIRLAGNHIDEKLAEKMHKKFMQKKEVNLSFEELKSKFPETYYQLLAKCERAKCDFSDEDEVSINLNKYADYGPVREYLEYDDFKLLVATEIDKAIECLKKTILKANLNIQTLDCILCVGGSSNLRPLREKLKEIYSDYVTIYFPEKTMWNIAKGAAIISQKPGKHALSRPIGILLSDDSFLPLVSENEKIPCNESSITLALTEDEQDGENSAKFIFTDAEYEVDRTFTDYKTVPVRAFDDEKIKLSYYIDPNFIFKLKIETNRKVPEDMWVYDKVKVYYQIEE